MLVQSYLFFDGRCDEALEFYRRALGAEVKGLMRFKDSPNPEMSNPGGADPNKVMHCAFRVGDTEIMASDGQCLGKPSFQGFSLVLNAKSEAEANRWFSALSDGGKVQMPLSKTFFATAFGMLADRFGVMWMVIVPAAGN